MEKNNIDDRTQGNPGNQSNPQGDNRKQTTDPNNPVASQDRNQERTQDGNKKEITNPNNPVADKDRNREGFQEKTQGGQNKENNRQRDSQGQFTDEYDDDDDKEYETADVNRQANSRQGENKPGTERPSQK